MGTPIYDGIASAVELARAGGEMRGRLAERKEILELLLSISSRPTNHLKKAIELVEARIDAPLNGDRS